MTQDARKHTKYFNSRPHGGRRWACSVMEQKQGYFNSRPHGGRQETETQAAAEEVFQLTPSRRATERQRTQTSEKQHFNSRPHGGRRCTRQFHGTNDGYFNSRPHGGRLLRVLRRASRWHFNSRPHGGRLRKPSLRLLIRYFNSRPHGGRRQI